MRRHLQLYGSGLCGRREAPGTSLLHLYWQLLERRFTDLDGELSEGYLSLFLRV